MNPRFRVLAIGCAAVALAGCGASSHAATAKPTAAVKPSVSASAVASPSPSGLPGVSTGDFPAQDTPYSQAPVSLQTVWARFNISTIPGQEIFQNQPAIPPLVNETGSGMTDTQAKEIVEAYWRSMAIYQWAAARDDTSLVNLLVTSEWMVNGEYAALSGGEDVTDPDCDLYADVAIDVAPATSAVIAYYHEFGLVGASTWTLVFDVSPALTTGCTVTATANGHTTVLATGSGTQVISLTGGPVSADPDPALGTGAEDIVGVPCAGTHPNPPGACTPQT
jgi:hypothetical protein